MPNPIINRRAPGVAISSGGFVYDAEVLDWVSRVEANGGSVSASTKNAANTFMLAIKAANIRSKIYRLNLYAGTGLAACLTPLIKDIGSASETNANFVSGDYSESTGLTGDGASKWISTGATLADLYNIDATNHAMSYGLYVRTASNFSSLNMGTYDGTNFSYLSVANLGNSYYSMTDNGAGIGPVSDSNGNGFYLGVRLSTTSMKLYKNGSQLATTVTPGSLTSSAIVIYVNTVNNNNGGGGVAPDNRAHAGYQLSTDFDATQQANLYNAWQAFQTTLGRQV